ncbi:lipoyl(octanoyl) transferase LipB [Methylocystis sp. H62]|uniref:lipoyl(octanoyl) transferase LipB n=1 Tax=Methylocystis sp. H62 TaxID=2785789 RepID=UPI0018C218B2|nr:lipoyl(octanoyl) transferase LipB [Methylocystis sp. H62]MBG0793994.1 lipoyl(octanoyl) transferase LipB [Methylocystis sp. H62]
MNLAACPPAPAAETSMRAPTGAPPVEWRLSDDLVPYEAAVAFMEARAAAIASGEARECVWLLQHPPIYTGGSSAKEQDLLEARFPVHRTGRGGQFTYHGPKQRVAYVMLDLSRRQRDVRAFVCALESWIIATLADFGVTGERRAGRVGVWVARPEKAKGRGGEMAEDKIAAIGVRLRQWVSFHGIALNVAPDLTHFSGIAPCGVRDAHLGVTSVADLGVAADMPAVDAALRRNFEAIFGPTNNA